jgi:hypothetical protein
MDVCRLRYFAAVAEEPHSLRRGRTACVFPSPLALEVGGRSELVADERLELTALGTVG